MKSSELKRMSWDQMEAKLVKLDKVIATHPQKSMKAQAGHSKRLVLSEMEKRMDTERMENGIEV